MFLLSFHARDFVLVGIIIIIIIIIIIAAFIEGHGVR